MKEGDDTGPEEQGRNGDSNRNSLENVIAVETARCSRQATRLHGHHCTQRQYPLPFLPVEDTSITDSSKTQNFPQGWPDVPIFS